MLRHAFPCWAILGVAGPCWAMLGHAGPCWAMLDHAGPCWAMLGQTEPCWTIKGCTCRSVLDHAELYWVVLDHAGHAGHAGLYYKQAILRLIYSCKNRFSAMKRTILNRFQTSPVGQPPLTCLCVNPTDCNGNVSLEISGLFYLVKFDFFLNLVKHASNFSWISKDFRSVLIFSSRFNSCIVTS